MNEFKFCPTCGKPLPEEQLEQIGYQVCTSCGWLSKAINDIKGSDSQPSFTVPIRRMLSDEERIRIGNTLQPSVMAEGFSGIGCGFIMLLIPLGITQIIGVCVMVYGCFRFFYGSIADNSSSISSKSLRDPSLSDSIPSYELKGTCRYCPDELIVMMSKNDNYIVKKQACKTCGQETLIKDDRFHKRTQ